MGERDIELSGDKERSPLSLGLTQREFNLLKLFLNESASEGEIASASVAFARSLRDRNVSAVDWEPLLEVIEPEEPVSPPEVVLADLTHFQVLTAYVLGLTGVPDGMENLHAQFHRQAVFSGRI